MRFVYIKYGHYHIYSKRIDKDLKGFKIISQKQLAKEISCHRGASLVHTSPQYTDSLTVKYKPWSTIEIYLHCPMIVTYY